MPSRPRVQPQQSGLTLVELLVAIVIAGLVITAAGTALIGHLRSSKEAEALERQRSDWSRSTFFLDAEVSLSQEVITDQARLSRLTIPASCSAISPSQLRFALRLRPDLPLVLYGVQPSSGSWLPDNSLVRCGPAINADGSYGDATPQLQLLVDGLAGNAAGGGLEIESPDGRQLSFTLALRGLASSTISQQSTSQARANPFYERPDERTLCFSSSNIPASGAVQVICNPGANAALIATTANLIVEAWPATATTGTSITATTGNLRLLGNAGSNSLSSGSGDDSLVGLAGNDSLSGGAGLNRYLPGPGNDTVNGGSGVDVVFFTGPRSAYTLTTCSRSSCSVTSSAEGTDSLSNVEVLVFGNEVEYLN
jgi:prepilin-type N-terminal cleavage/methylation domain-containing protein